jgi:hypothetical protein
LSGTAELKGFPGASRRVFTAEAEDFLKSLFEKPSREKEKSSTKVSKLGRGHAPAGVEEEKDENRNSHRRR